MLLPVPTSVRARGKALERTLQSLLRKGFVEEVAVAWRSDHDGRFGLRITEPGCVRPGVDERARSWARDHCVQLDTSAKAAAAGQQAGPVDHHAHATPDRLIQALSYLIVEQVDAAQS
jgi:hypothetical protein